MAVPKLNLTPQQQQWFADNTRMQDGKLYQRQPNGSWAQATGPVMLPGSNRPTGGPGGVGNGGAGTIGVSLPIVGGGADRPTIPGGASGPGGATFRPGTPAPPIAGSGLGASFTPPPTPAPATPPTPTPTPTSTPTPPPTTPTPDDDGIMDAIMDALKKYGSSPALAALGKMIADWRVGRQEGRKEEQSAANQNNTTNILRNNSAMTGINADILQRNYLGENYDRNADNAVRGGYLQGVEDINIPRPAGVPTRNITGGLRPSAFVNRKEVGAALEKEAMTELLDPTRMANDPRPATKRLPAVPVLPDKIDVPEPGAFDTALDWIGMGASTVPFITALIDAASKPPKATTPTANDLPIVPPDPLRPNIPQINLGDAPLDPYGTQGLIDTLQRRKRGPGAYFPTL
jgi:hypothetical protein